MQEIRKTVCNRDCPDACSIVATVEDGRVVRLAGDPAHPITRGFLCYRTSCFLETQYSPERLTTPLLRKGGELTPVSWDEALDTAAERLLRIRAESGPAAIFHYRSGGSLGMLTAMADAFSRGSGRSRSSAATSAPARATPRSSPTSARRTATTSPT